MGRIAQYTTPAISFKPSMVEVEAIDLIEMVMKQRGKVKITKGLEDAQINEGRFVWLLTQEETALLDPKAVTTIKIDYKSRGMRYTTEQFEYKTEESAISEVL